MFRQMEAQRRREKGEGPCEVLWSISIDFRPKNKDALCSQGHQPSFINVCTFQRCMNSGSIFFRKNMGLKP